MEETSNVNVMDKNLNDLTVRDALKINLVVIAATVAIPVVLVGASSAFNAVKAKIRGRKTAHLNLVPNEEK